MNFSNSARYAKLSSPPQALELDGNEFKSVVEMTMKHLVQHLETLDQHPAWEDTRQALQEAQIDCLPSSPMSITDVLEDYFSDRIWPAFNPSSSGYLGYVPGGGILLAAVADLIANTLNRYVTVNEVAPKLSMIEHSVIQWFVDSIGYPAGAGGFLTTGGSMANWSALVTARRCRLPDNFLDALIYTSNQAHHSVLKAAIMAGFPEANVRVLTVDNDYRIDPVELAMQVEQDRDAGKSPFLVVAHAGTVNTGTIDPIDALADVCQAENLWLHVDGSYGGFFCLTERGKRRLKGIHRADSITLDPHKGLFLPYGTGCLLVQLQDHLHSAHYVAAEYLPKRTEPLGVPSICEISPELSRDFRALRIWLPLTCHGIDTFGEYLDEKIDLAHWAYEQLSGHSTIRIVAAPELSLLAFVLEMDEEIPLERRNELNAKMLSNANRSRRFLLTSTVIDGQLIVRMCILCFRTHLPDVEFCVREVQRAADEVISEIS